MQTHTHTLCGLAQCVHILQIIYSLQTDTQIKLHQPHIATHITTKAVAHTHTHTPLSNKNYLIQLLTNNNYHSVQPIHRMTILGKDSRPPPIQATHSHTIHFSGSVPNPQTHCVYSAHNAHLYSHNA